MQSSNVVSEAIGREWRALMAPKSVCISIPAVFHNGVCLPCPEGLGTVQAKFSRASCEEYWGLESELTIRVELGGGRDVTSYVDIYELRRQFVRRFLRSWNLDVVLSFDNETGWLTDECFEEVCSLSGPLMMSLAAKYETDIFPDEGDQLEIEKQCAMLFSEHSSGVAEPCETIALYCVSSNFWDKFGLNRKDLRELPYREFLRLRMMVHRENSVMSAKMRSAKKKSKGK